MRETKQSYFEKLGNENLSTSQTGQKTFFGLHLEESQIKRSMQTSHILEEYILLLNFLLHENTSIIPKALYIQFLILFTTMYVLIIILVSYIVLFFFTAIVLCSFSFFASLGVIAVQLVL